MPQRSYKPRPVPEIEADLATVRVEMATPPKNYDASHYDYQRMLKRNLVELRAELRASRRFYGLGDCWLCDGKQVVDGEPCEVCAAKPAGSEPSE